MHLTIRKRVVLRDDHRALVALVHRRFAKAHHPLRALGVEAEEVGAGIDQRGGLCARAAVDEGHLRLRLGVVLDGNALTARQRSDHDFDLVLLDQLAGGVDGHVWLGVGAGLDDFNLAPCYHAAALLDGQFGPAHSVGTAGRERAFQRGQKTNLNGLALPKGYAI